MIWIIRFGSVLIAKCPTIPSKKVIRCGFGNMIYYYAFYLHFNFIYMYSYIYCTIFPHYILSTDHWAIISEALHTDEFSIIDNATKIRVIVNNVICPETCARMYDLYEKQ